MQMSKEKKKEENEIFIKDIENKKRDKRLHYG